MAFLVQLIDFIVALQWYVRNVRKHIHTHTHTYTHTHTHTHTHTYTHTVTILYFNNIPEAESLPPDLHASCPAIVSLLLASSVSDMLSVYIGTKEQRNKGRKEERNREERRVEKREVEKIVK